MGRMITDMYDMTCSILWVAEEKSHVPCRFSNKDENLKIAKINFNPLFTAYLYTNLWMWVWGFPELFSENTRSCIRQKMNTEPKHLSEAASEDN